jgi:hypothetical protein
MSRNFGRGTDFTIYDNEGGLKVINFVQQKWNKNNRIHNKMKKDKKREIRIPDIKKDKRREPNKNMFPKNFLR